jgi:tetratricopeptide (TPR) repeat protein
MDVNELIKIAEDSFDSNQFAKAVEYFRKAALVGLPDKIVLTNLSFAERHEVWEFRKRLRDLYPDAFDISLEETMALSTSGLHEQAFRQYTELLEMFSQDAKSVYRIRLMRFGLACEFGSVSRRFLLEDFQALWMAEEISPTLKLRPVVLGILFRYLRDVKDIPVLEQLLTVDFLPGVVKIAIQRKIVEVQALADAFQYLKLADSGGNTEEHSDTK